MDGFLTLDQRILAVDERGHLVELLPGVTLEIDEFVADGLCTVRLGPTCLKVFGSDLTVRAHAG